MNETTSAASNRPGSSVRSLADVRRGETVRIQGILFGALRELCSAIGIEEGDDVRCRSASRSAVLLETTEGRTAVLDSDWARFVQISGVDPQLARRDATATAAGRNAERRDARVG